MKKDDKQHSEIGPSSSERYINCNASVMLARQAPPQEDGPWAEEGILAHSHLEKWLNHIKVSPLAYTLPKDLSNNDNMEKAVRSAAYFISKTWNRKYQELEIEVRVDLSFIHPDMSGTSDIILSEIYNELHSWDYKHGKGHAVDVFTKTNGKLELNTQLVLYALGKLHQINYDVRTVRLGVIQPRASHKDGPIRAITVSVNEIKKYIDIFKRAIDKVYGPNPKYEVGSWCFFCPAKTICPKQEQIKFEKNVSGFDEVY